MSSVAKRIEYLQEQRAQIDREIRELEQADGPTSVPCPECGCEEFEERGDVRRYVQASVAEKDGRRTLVVDGWDDASDTYAPDRDDDDNELLYCAGCDAEFTHDELGLGIDGSS